MAVAEGTRRARRGSHRWVGYPRQSAQTTILAIAVLAAVLSVGSSSAPAASAASASRPDVKLTPARPHDGQTVMVTVTGAAPGSALLAVECSSAALEIGEDGCENHRNAVFFADAIGNASATLVVTSEISTAAGPERCVTTTCLLGVVRFTSPTSDEIVGARALSFVSAVCHGGSPCEDAPPIPSTVASARGRVGPVRGATLVTPSAMYEADVIATAATGLALLPPSAITGPYRPSARPAGLRPKISPARRAPRPDKRGEGLLQLSMEGPGTSWASATDKAVVVSVRVDRGPWQQIVLFAGSRPFTYAGFTGALTVGRHRVSVRVDARRSTTASHLPTVALYRVRLRVVAPGNRMYLLERYAPVIYGRASSASSDTQLLTYGTATRLGGGATQLSYETVWSHEDAGTSFVPFLEWGEWGRMTDITATVSLEVSATGAISHPMYNWCGCRPPFPPSRDSLQEVSVPFRGRYFDGTHMIVRNASGNDYQSEVGTTDFRFQQPAVAGPARGLPREAVMDTHPWTYRIMAEEVRYWYLDRSTNPDSAQPGIARQYAIISLDTSAPRANAVAVDLRLSGSPGWYRSDMGSAAPLYTGGLGRTVVKLPEDWERRRITGVRLVVYPASAASALVVHSFEVRGLNAAFKVLRIVTPAPEVLGARVSPCVVCVFTLATRSAPSEGPVRRTG